MFLRLFALILLAVLTSCASLSDRELAPSSQVKKSFGQSALER
jgi:hypothetical protein